MKTEVEIGGRVFRSKTSLTEHVRQLVRKYREGERLRGEDEALVMDLLQRHPWVSEKVGVGVKWITVRTNVNAVGRPTRGFWITRHDGTETDFSWVACVTPPSLASDVRSAFRAAISSQVEAFRRSAFDGPRVPFCPLTGWSLSPETAHVDHEHPDTFEALVNRFLAGQGLRIEDVPTGGWQDGSLETVLSDATLLRAWQEFHSEHARLRLLSRTANLSHARKAHATRTTPRD
jgi:hypothetical protein